MIGTWITSLVFGGEFPGPDLLERFYVLHILIVPAVLAVLISVHLAILVRHKHTQYPGPGRRDDNVVGERLWPTYAAKAMALFFMTGAVVFLLGGLVQINPVWIYGPFRPADVERGIAARLVHGLPRRRAAHLPAVGDPRLRLRGPEPVLPRGRARHGLLRRAVRGAVHRGPLQQGRRRRAPRPRPPRDRPLRTALGVGVLFFYVTLLGAASSDVLSARFGLSVNSVIWVFRFAVFVVPVVTAVVAYNLCNELRRRDGPVPPQELLEPRPAPARAEDQQAVS